MANSQHKTNLGHDDILPPKAPYWYSDSEAMAYREGYMLGVAQGAIEMHRKIELFREKSDE